MQGMRPLSDEELNLISKSFGGAYATRNKALFTLMLKTGYRVTEALSLRIKDVYQGGKMVNVVNVARKNMKKKTAGRNVPLHDCAKEALFIWIKELLAEGAMPETFIFVSKKSIYINKPMSRVCAWQILNEVYEANGIESGVGCHGLRKSFAVRVYEKVGHDLLKTKRALGHENVNNTVKYLQCDDQEVNNAILSI
jgi:integrase